MPTPDKLKRIELVKNMFKSYNYADADIPSDEKCNILHQFRADPQNLLATWAAAVRANGNKAPSVMALRAFVGASKNTACFPAPIDTLLLPTGNANDDAPAPSVGNVDATPSSNNSSSPLEFDNNVPLAPTDHLGDDLLLPMDVDGDILPLVQSVCLTEEDAMGRLAIAVLERVCHGRDVRSVLERFAETSTVAGLQDQYFGAMLASEELFPTGC
jgi:hypothetical protein